MGKKIRRLIVMCYRDVDMYGFWGAVKYWFFTKIRCSYCGDIVIPKRKVFCADCDVIVNEILNRTMEEDHSLHTQLLVNIKENISELKAMFEKYNDHWHYEDPVYRFYHNSFKVFKLQEYTLEIFEMLRKISPPKTYINMKFTKLIQQGTGKEFSLADNEKWLEVTGPIVAAFFHTRFMLEMACRYGEELSEAPDMLPSGWAALLYLYTIR